MNRKQWQNKVGQKNIKINLNKIFHFSDLNVVEMLNYDNEMEGRTLSIPYHYDSGIIEELNILLCRDWDKKGWDTEIGPIKYSLDKETLSFIDVIIEGIWKTNMRLIGEPNKKEFGEVECYILPTQENLMWKIFFYINEIHKFIYNVPAFEFAQYIMKATGNSIGKRYGIREIRKNISDICEKVVEVQD